MPITKGSRAAHERSLKAAETRRRNKANKGAKTVITPRIHAKLSKRERLEALYQKTYQEQLRLYKPGASYKDLQRAKVLNIRLGKLAKTLHALEALKEEPPPQVKKSSANHNPTMYEQIRINGRWVNKVKADEYRQTTPPRRKK